jgi:hypothetical protein
LVDLLGGGPRLRSSAFLAWSSATWMSWLACRAWSSAAWLSRATSSSAWPLIARRPARPPPGKWKPGLGQLSDLLLGVPGALVGLPGLVLGDLDELVGLRDLRLRGLQALGERFDLFLHGPGVLVGLPGLVLGDLDELVGLQGLARRRKARGEPSDPPPAWSRFVTPVRPPPARLAVAQSDRSVPRRPGRLGLLGLVLGDLDELVGLLSLLLGGLGAMGELSRLLLGGLGAMGEVSHLLLGAPGALVGLARLALGDLDELVGLQDLVVQPLRVKLRLLARPRRSALGARPPGLLRGSLLAWSDCSAALRRFQTPEASLAWSSPSARGPQQP